MRITYHVYRGLWMVVDLVYPPRCAGCGKTGTRWCTKCRETTPKFSKNVCVYCQKRLVNPPNCSNCGVRETHLDELHVWGLYLDPLREAIHRLKYRRDLGLGEVLAGHLAELVKGMRYSDYFVLAVPLGKKRLKERGYNQAGYLAGPLALQLGLPFSPKAIRRIRETRTQVGLTLEERKNNVSDAFWADNRLVAGAKILLVDDVLTTGATINAAGKALKEAGADHVIGLALARVP